MSKRKAFLLALLTTVLISLGAFALAHMTSVPTSAPIPWFLRDFLLSLFGLKLLKVLLTLAGASFLGASFLTWNIADQIFEKILTKKHSHLVENGDILLAKSDLAGALILYIQANRFNEKHLHSGTLRLSDLSKLANVYRQSEDRTSYLDVESRIKAIEAERERRQVAADEPWQKALRPKLGFNLAGLACFVAIYLAILGVAGFFWHQVYFISLLVIATAAIVGALVALILNIACRIDSISLLLSATFNRIFLEREADRNVRNA